jgi:uncharacterized protein (TIGR02117 family)
LKATLRWLGRAIILIVLAIAAGTFIPRPLWPPARAANSAETIRPVLVLSNPIHTDIAIPLDDVLRTRFAFLAEAGVPVGNPGAKYLVIGWGGRSFYLETPHWADIKPLPVLRALTIDRSVMHVDVTGTLRDDDPAITRLQTDDVGMARMLDFIRSSFAQQDGKPMPILDTRYGRYDAFYEANGFFNALIGCNTWTARALREAGLRTGTWNPVPQTLAISLKLYN